MTQSLVSKVWSFCNVLRHGGNLLDAKIASAYRPSMTANLDSKDRVLSACRSINLSL